ncbi:MAG: site-specific DNA-methyltransferase [Dehalococcoidia bacterium]
MAKGKKPIEQYDHKGKTRINNPPVGLVTPETDRETGKKSYSYDPHLDPQLVWAGKAEHMSFEVPTVSLHVHERIDPRTIIEAVHRRNGRDYEQASFFHMIEENPPLREAIEFYKHKHGWSNRLIAGDSLLVMNSLLEKEGLARQVQMIYIDPPYGIKYGSNFQPFVNKRDVKDGKDEDLTQEPEMIKAFRDTWELGIHSYLTYLRDRLLLARELLADSGSVFVQISDENIHLVRCVMDDVFKAENHCATIAWKKASPETKIVRNSFNYLLWYAKHIGELSKKTKKLFYERVGIEGTTEDPKKLALWADFPDGESRPLTTEEKRNIWGLPKGAKVFRVDKVVDRGETDGRFGFKFGHKTYWPKSGYSWRGDPKEMERLKQAGRIVVTPEGLGYKFYISDFPVIEMTNLWEDTAGKTPDMIYAVQTNPKIIERCVLISTDPGDLVFDPTCGSGTTAYVSEQWGRRWITCDTSRVAITLAKQRLMTALYHYYQLAHPEEGVSSGFKYKTISHITLKSIAKNESPEQETLYNQPFVDSSKVRVSGPFTVEAVPAPAVKPFIEIEEELPADESIARSGETLRQAEWRDELLKTGIRGKRGQYILFSRVEPLPGTRWLHAEAETKPNDRGADSVREGQATFGQPQRVVISFGPEHAPLEQRQVALAIEEAQTLVPKPKIIAFVAFQFDPEAAKDIDETDWPGVTLLKAQMNADLLTDDLKKKRASSDSYWLIGQPDVSLEKITEGKDKGKYQVKVIGFDYYNTKTGALESGGTANIAMWLLDTDYDGRSLFPRQVFFPMAGEKEGWSRLARNLKAELDEDLLEAYRGTVSLPFKPGDNKRIAVKIIDDRGIESLRIIGVGS